MHTQAFQDFKSQAQAEGYDEVLERSWPADLQIDTHTHAFALKLRVVRGEMWVTLGETSRHLRPGDELSLAREQAHAERYGYEGATYWVARQQT